MEKRKTVKDWRKAWRNSVAKTQKIEADIKVRLRDLCTAHPDIIVGTAANSERTPIKAKAIADLNHIQGMDTSAVLAYIEIIEKALADAHPHKQLTMYDNV